MSKVKVYQAQDADGAVANPVFSKAEEALDAVRRRAFQLFEKRGRVPGEELSDWLRAEQDVLFLPQAEVDETADVFRVKISTPGFDASDIEVIALPRELLVEAKTERRLPGREDARDDAFDARYLYSRFELTAPIETDKVTARIDEGELKIEAPRKIVRRVSARVGVA